jgi:hypothetical protein
MDLLDLIWDASQERRIREVRAQVDQMQLERDRHGWDLRTLAAENVELRMRLGLLVRLLIGKGLITAQEYAALVAEAQPKPDAGRADPGAAPDRGGV